MEHAGGGQAQEKARGAEGEMKKVYFLPTYYGIPMRILRGGFIYARGQRFRVYASAADVWKEVRRLGAMNDPNIRVEKVILP